MLFQLYLNGKLAFEREIEYDEELLPFRERVIDKELFIKAQSDILRSKCLEHIENAKSFEIVVIQQSRMNFTYLLKAI